MSNCLLQTRIKRWPIRSRLLFISVYITGTVHVEGFQKLTLLEIIGEKKKIIHQQLANMLHTA